MVNGLPRPLRADVVILADSHNPSIASPEWVKTHLGIAAEPQSFVHTSEISVLDFADVQLTIDRARLQIASKDLEPDPAAAAGLATQYVSVLQHIPYKAVGLNLSFAVDLKSEMAVLCDDRKLPGIFGPYSLTFGTIIAGAASDHRLRVIVEPAKEGEKLQLSFNFHFDVSSAETCWAALARAGEFTDVAGGLVNEFFGARGVQA